MYNVSHASEVTSIKKCLFHDENAFSSEIGGNEAAVATDDLP